MTFADILKMCGSRDTFRSENAGVCGVGIEDAMRGNMSNAESKVLFKKMIAAARKSLRESGGDVSAAHARAYARAFEQAPGMLHGLCMDLSWQAVLAAR